MSATGVLCTRGHVFGYIVILSVLSRVSSSPEAKRLYDDLLKRSGYNKLIRPVGNTSDTLMVKLGLSLTQIIDVVSLEFGLQVSRFLTYKRIHHI